MHEDLNGGLENSNGQNNEAEIAEDFNPDKAAEEVAKRKEETAEKESTKEAISREYISLLKELAGNIDYDYDEQKKGIMWSVIHRMPALAYFANGDNQPYRSLNRDFSSDFDPEFKDKMLQLYIVDEVLASKQELDNPKAPDINKSARMQEEEEKRPKRRFARAVYLYSKAFLKEENIENIVNERLLPSDQDIDQHAKFFFSEERKEKIEHALELRKRLCEELSKNPSVATDDFMKKS